MELFEAFFAGIWGAFRIAWIVLTVFWPVTLILMATGVTVGLIIHHFL